MRFQQDPVEHFHVRLRQLRAEQLQRLLSSPASITLDVFNHEIWVLGRVFVNGRSIGNLVDAGKGVTLDQLPALEEALDIGHIDIQGNSIWGTSTSIYGTMLQESDEAKVQYIQRALTLLINASLSPLEKVLRIQEIPGFGPNISTGLVMVFHPLDFALYNQPSQDGMKKLGFPYEKLEAFEASTIALKQQLGAVDFIELDWFLYLVHKGRIIVDPISTQADRQVWWVNQGATFAVEKAGGYLWAPLHGKSQRTFQHHSDMAKLRPGGVVMHYASGALRAVSQVLEDTKTAPRPGELPTDTEQTEGYLTHVDYHLLERPIPLQDVPVDWRLKESGPFTTDGAVKFGYLFPLSQGFATKMHERFREYLPTFFPTNNEKKQTWLFQANPKIYDFSADLKQQVVGATDDWSVTTHRSEMHPGDRVLLWEAGPQAGLLAIGELTGELFQREPSTWRPDKRGETEWAVPFRYTYILRERILRSAFLLDPVLQNMHHIRNAQGTNFKVSNEEWEALQKLIDLQPKVTPTPTPIGFAELCQCILEQGLDFSPEIVANYLLALQTKRFALLTGISGTGKTQLALAVARCLNGSSLISGSSEIDVIPKRNEGKMQPKYCRLVAVRPDWHDNRGLLGYYNPLLERYAVTPILRLLLCAEEEFEAAARERREAIPFFIILDEMNLARVEYYFSDFLSSLESGEPLDLQEHTSTGMNETGEVMTVPAQLKIHNNVFFTGTVNIDETTYMFSPKVLDRAFTLELNDVDLSTFSLPLPKSDTGTTALYLHRFSGWLRYDHKPNKTDWESFGQLLAGELQGVVVDLNALLRHDRRNFGYRVAVEIARFVNLAAEQTEDTDAALWTALDLAIEQKVLPKFNGTQQELEEVLVDVFVFAITGKFVEKPVKVRLQPETWSLENSYLVLKVSGTGDDYAVPRLPRTAAKVWVMWNRLRKQGFTSYLS